MTDTLSFKEKQEAIEARLAGMDIDFDAMWAVSNTYRATAAVRNHLEQTVLRDTGLSWTGFVVMWVVWVWGDVETRIAAAESGISKGTLTGVAKTLESYRYVIRKKHPSDGRRVILAVTPTGKRLMEDLFPAVNREEAFMVRGLDVAERKALAASLRTVIEQLEQQIPARQ